MSSENKEKIRKYKREWAKKNYSKIAEESKERSRIAHWKLVENDPIKLTLQQLKSSAKKRGLEFNLTKEDFQNLPTHCPIFKKPISIRNPDKMWKLTVDRIDNSKGYVKGNICFISMKANMYKKDMMFDDIENMYLFYKDLFNR